MAGSIPSRHKRVMRKILNLKDLSSVVEQQKKLNKKIVLAGGCFDILHSGHVAFLEAAKKEGNVLILLLESDENIKKRKGEGRPLNSMRKRLAMLSSLQTVDFIIPLTGVTKSEEYDRIMIQIKPDIVAMTNGDPSVAQRTRQCEKIGAKLKLVIEKIDGISTTALVSKFIR